MTELTEMSGQDENCSVIVKLKCSHMLHKSCLKAMYDSGTQVITAIIIRAVMDAQKLP